MPPNPSLPVILVYRTGLLPSTQTFVTAQVNATRGFSVQYVGLGPVDGGIQCRPPAIFLSHGARIGDKAAQLMFKLFGHAPRFTEDIKKTEPKLIHAHFLMDGVHALPLARALKIPLVVTLHGHLPTGSGHVITKRNLDGWIYERRLPHLWAYASRFICVSEYIRSKAIELGFPEEKLIVHYIGIDLNRFRPSETESYKDRIVFVGRLVEKKGCRYLLKAMQIVQAQRPSAHLVVVGDGPERRELESMAAENALKCSFVGNKCADEVLSHLRGARVFCAPSVTASDGDAEALGMVFAEAQALGVPVVSFEHGGIPEVVEHGATGLLAPERDYRTLASYILRYLTDDRLWGETSRSCLDAVRKRFDIEKQTRLLEGMYASCIGEGVCDARASMPKQASIAGWRPY